MAKPAISLKTSQIRNRTIPDLGLGVNSVESKTIRYGRTGTGGSCCCCCGSCCCCCCCGGGSVQITKQ